MILSLRTLLRKFRGLHLCGGGTAGSSSISTKIRWLTQHYPSDPYYPTLPKLSSHYLSTKYNKSYLGGLVISAMFNGRSCIIAMVYVARPDRPHRVIVEQDRHASTFPIILSGVKKGRTRQLRDCSCAFYLDSVVR